MVDIIIGSVPAPGPPVNQPANSNGGAVEAEILNIRAPRQKINVPDEERRRQFRQDPHNSQVLTVLIPSSTNLPRDLDARKYKAMVRFIKK
ncbi:MAG: hypothetical protein CSA20_00940 [Deltaproteobacteria bacterium]|nr:MAG: hypothetical protein CSA20_00940 [Deltaproteobacteria bacterium]